MPDAPKTVPPRNNIADNGLYRNSRATHLRNQDPSFHYEWKSIDEHHPRALRKTGQLDEHEVGTQIGGFVTVKGWEPVHRGNDKATAVESRSDQGKGVDTLIHHGNKILCRMHKDEYAKYAVADKAYQDAMERQIYSPDHQRVGENSMTAVVSRDEYAERTRMLRDAGHPIPGIS